MNVLMWYKLDLRVEDHPALAHAANSAAASGMVLPLHIVEPDYWAQPDRSGRHWAFQAECLQELRHELAGRGAPLVVRVGDAVEVLSRFCRQHRIGKIVSHREFGSAWVQARNQRVVGWARQAGIEWVELAQEGHMMPETPQSLPPFAGVEPGVFPLARALRLPPDPCPHRQIGGRSQALLLSESFLAGRGQPYRSAHNQMPLAERAATRLSPYLSFGAFTARELRLSIGTKQNEKPAAPWGASLKALLAHLDQRHDFDMVLEAPCPDETQASGQHGPTDIAAKPAFLALAAGQTGLPFLDASLRYLAATGWLPAAARQMLLGFAIGTLNLSPTQVGQFLARRFTDYDPALLWPHVARQSQQGICLTDPARHAQMLDPTGQFTRRWVPELAALPDIYLQKPWLCAQGQGLLGRHYPEAIVDMAALAKSLPRKSLQQASQDQGGISAAFAGAMASMHSQLSLDL